MDADEVKRFFHSQIVQVWNTQGGYSGLEAFERDYQGPYKNLVTRFVRKIGEINKNTVLRVYGLNSKTIEEILNLIVLEDSLKRRL